MTTEEKKPESPTDVLPEPETSADPALPPSEGALAEETAEKTPHDEPLGGADEFATEAPHAESAAVHETAGVLETAVSSPLDVPVEAGPVVNAAAPLNDAEATEDSHAVASALDDAAASAGIPDGAGNATSEPHDSYKKSGVVLAVVSGFLTFLMMAVKGHVPFSIPLGMLLLTACGTGVLAAIGSFEDRGEGEIAAPLGAPLLQFLGGGAAFALSLALAGASVGPALLWSVLVPTAFLGWVVTFFRLGVIAGPYARDGRGPIHSRYGFWLIALGAVLYLPAMGLQSLWDPWETHYGEVAREILQRDDWISLWWAQDGWFWSKPILNFWVQALAMGTLHAGYQPDMMLQGFHGAIARPEWIVRAPNVLMTIGALYIAYKGVSKVFGSRAGFLGGLVLATMPQWYLISHQTMADMPMVAPLTAAMGMLMLGLNTDSDQIAKTFTVSLFGRRARVSGFHFLMLLILVPALAQSLYLVSRNFDFLVNSPEGFGFRPHFDTFKSGSAGNCTLPGNEQCASNSPVTLPKLTGPAWTVALRRPFMGVEPTIQALIWTAVLGFFLQANKDERRVQRLLFHGAWLLAAFATMGKGPLGIVLPMVCAFAYLCTRRRFVELTRLEVASGLALIACVALPWYVAMYVRHGAGFTDRLIFHDMVNRTFGHVHDTNEGDDTSFRFYAWQLGYATFPWTGIVPLALLRWMRRADDADKGKGDTAVFLVMWFVFAFGLFSFMGTKFHHYILPAVPPLALLSGIVLDELIGREAALPGAADFSSVVRRLGLIFGAAIAMVAGISMLMPGSFFGATSSAPPAAETMPVRVAGGLLFGGGLGLLCVLLFGGEKPAARTDDAANTHERLLTAAGTFAGVGALALVGRDVAMGPAAGEVMGAARFLCLYTYQYKRAWPDNLDFTGALTALSVVAVVAAVLLSVAKFRARVVPFVAAIGVLSALWGIDIYMVKTSPHWGQREVIAAYYKDRKGPEQPLVAYQLNWKGENFYTSNNLPAFVASGQKFKDWIRDERAKGHNVLYFVTEHGRVGGLKSEVGTATWRDVSTKEECNKFVVVRAEF